MKKLMYALAFTFFGVYAHAQTEIKINPIGALFASPDVSVEFAVNPNFGIEPFVGLSFPSLTVEGKEFGSTGLGYGVHGKYYFGEPENGIAGFYAGLFLRGGSTKFTSDVNTTDKFSRNRLGAGFELGYKWTTQKNIIFEVGGGVGRKIYNKYSNTSNSVNLAKIPLLNFDGFLRFNVGYRFGGGGGTSRK